MEQTFQGQSIVITGGSGGIAIALSQDLIARGAAEVVLTGRDRDKLTKAAAQLGPRVRAQTFDATDEAAVAAFFTNEPQIDHLVTTAAGTARWLRMIDTPLRSAHLSKEEQRACFRKVGAGLPVGRAGLAEDVADAGRFLMETA